MSGPDSHEDNTVKEIGEGKNDDDLGINELSQQPSFLAVSTRSSSQFERRGTESLFSVG